MSYTAPAPAAADFTLSGGYTPPAAAGVAFVFGAAIKPPVAIAVAAGWAQHTRRDRRVDLAFSAYRQLDHRPRLAWGGLRQLAPTATAPWNQSAATERPLRHPWNDAPQRPTTAQRAPWATPPANDRRSRQLWDASIAPRAAEQPQAWRNPPPKDESDRAPWYRVSERSPAYAPPYVYPPPAAERADFALASGYTPPAADALAFSLREPPPARPDQPRDSGLALPHIVPPTRDPVDAIPWDPAIARKRATGVRYPMQPPEPKPEPVAPHLAEVYALMPTIEVYRLPERTPVLVNAVSATNDLDSWCWQFRLTPARGEDMALLRPDAAGPKEVEIRINGYLWTALVEGYDRSRTFGASAYSLTARSLSAELGDRYAPARSKTQGEQRTAQQLVLEELLNTGWTLDWQAPDWLVPGGVWSYQELAPMQVILAILEATGARLQTDPSAKTLRVLPRYPVSPWEWSTTTPDAVLPEAQVVSESGRWEPRPAYNAIYVAGQAGGVLVHVKRMGTAGELVAPMQMHRLITDVAAGQERGRNELAASGNKELVTLQAPLLPAPWAPGLVLPGQLLEASEDGTPWRGLVVGATVSATRQNATTVRQQIEVERHYG